VPFAMQPNPRPLYWRECSLPTPEGPCQSQAVLPCAQGHLLHLLLFVALSGWPGCRSTTVLHVRCRSTSVHQRRLHADLLAACTLQVVRSALHRAVLLNAGPSPTDGTSSLSPSSMI
jgi:hypothetical protein